MECPKRQELPFFTPNAQRSFKSLDALTLGICLPLLAKSFSKNLKDSDLLNKFVALLDDNERKHLVTLVDEQNQKKEKEEAMVVALKEKARKFLDDSANVNVKPSVCWMVA